MNRKEFIMSLEDAGYRNCWLAYFDILGFKKLFKNASNPNALFVIRIIYEDVLLKLKAGAKQDIHTVWFSDTFIIFTPDDSPGSFEDIRLLAEEFFIECIGNEVPLRGAVSFGLFSFESAINEGIYLGNALIDAYTFAEDTDWIGLILTPYALERARCLHFYPERHSYRNKNIPMRKIKNEQIFAFVPDYCRESHPLYPNRHPLTPVLIAMQRKAPDKAQCKYVNTIQFFDFYYQAKGKEAPT